jgi:hypothetical protein
MTMIVALQSQPRRPWRNLSRRLRDAVFAKRLPAGGGRTALCSGCSLHGN